MALNPVVFADWSVDEQLRVENLLYVYTASINQLYPLTYDRNLAVRRLAHGWYDAPSQAHN